jgi:hypothetical protein
MEMFSLKLGLVVPASNPRTQEAQELEFSMGYIVRPCLKKEGKKEGKEGKEGKKEGSLVPRISFRSSCL